MFPPQFGSNQALAPCTQLLFQFSSFSVPCWIHGAGWDFPRRPREPGSPAAFNCSGVCVRFSSGSSGNRSSRTSAQQPRAPARLRRVTAVGTSALHPRAQGRIPDPPSPSGIWDGSDSFLCTHTEGFCFLHAASSRGSGAARPCQQHAAQVKGNRAALCSQKGPAPLCVPVLAGARGTWPRDAAPPQPPPHPLPFGCL